MEYLCGDDLTCAYLTVKTGYGVKTYDAELELQYYAVGNGGIYSRV